MIANKKRGKKKAKKKNQGYNMQYNQYGKFLALPKKKMFKKQTSPPPQKFTITTRKKIFQIVLKIFHVELKNKCAIQ